MPAFEPQPDYRRFVDAMWRREPDRVPLAEIGIDLPIKEQVLGRPIRDVKADVEFWHRAGYDYIYLRPAYEFPHTMPPATTTGRPQYDKPQEHEAASASLVGPGVIATTKDLDAYPWPDPDNDDYYKPLKEAAACLPPGMGLVSASAALHPHVDASGPRAILLRSCRTPRPGRGSLPPRRILSIRGPAEDT